MSEVINFDRKTVRALAEANSLELRNIALAGGNPYQKSLDQKDKINALVASMSEDDAVSFLNMYTEELNACTLKTNDETNQILIETASRNHSADVIAGTVGLIILFYVIFLMLD
jgi:hypothetical protein